MGSVWFESKGEALVGLQGKQAAWKALELPVLASCWKWGTTEEPGTGAGFEKQSQEEQA